MKLNLFLSGIILLFSKLTFGQKVELQLNELLNEWHVSAAKADFKKYFEVTAENLSTTLNNNTTTDITLTIKKPGATETAMIYVLKKARLDSESFSSSIGSNKTVDLTFSTQIGGPNDVTNGVFVSGIGSGSIF